MSGALSRRRSSVIKNSFRTPRRMDKSGQEDCDEKTKLKIRPEERDDNEESSTNQTSSMPPAP